MRPLILDYSIDRVGNYNPIYEYNSALSISIVNTKTGVVPFINIENADLLLATKTRVMGEADDDEKFCMLELETKTKVTQERDDEDGMYLLELSTKTLVRQEADD